MRKLIAGTLVAGLIGFGGVAYAASEPSPETGAPAGAAAAGDRGGEAGPARRACRRHPRACRHRMDTARRHAAEVAAKTIGISHDDLVAALRDGSSIADVAEKNGVDPSKVVDALVADATTRIDAAVEDGKIPEERAARIKERLPERMQKLVEREGPRGGRPAGPAEPDA